MLNCLKIIISQKIFEQLCITVIHFMDVMVTVIQTSSSPKEGRMPENIWSK